MKSTTKGLYLPLLFSITTFFALSTNAATFNAGDDGTSVAISFNGLVEGTVASGLTADVKITLSSVSVDEKTWTFDVTLENTSSSPITASRISMLGFNTDADPIVDDSTASGLFNKIGEGNVPQAGKVDICANNQNGNCAGGGGTGLFIGQSGAFTMELMFASGVSTLTLDNFLIRYQSITGTTVGGSGTGFGSEVPVPATAWLFGSALIGLAGIGRQRRA